MSDLRLTVELVEPHQEQPVRQRNHTEQTPEHRIRLVWAPWVVSGALHALLILLLGTVYFLTQEEEQEIPPLRSTSITPPPARREPTQTTRELLDPKLQLNVDSPAEAQNPLSALDLLVDATAHEDASDAPIAKGREESVSDHEMGGQGAFMAVGTGGGGAGMFGSRTGGGRRRAVGAGGGSKGSESAVEAALRWFKKHQSANGSWQHQTYFRNCTDEVKCEPGGGKGHDGWGDASSVDAAMTGYAVLCFLGAGYDHKTPNAYRRVVQSGLDYLVAQQGADGTILDGSRVNYHHPIATMALAEAYAMTSDPHLRDPTQRAVNQIIARQNQDNQGDTTDPGLGWDYVKPSQRNDASVTGWNVMALKSAYAAGINVGRSMDGAKAFLERSWKATNPGWDRLEPYKGISKFPYVWNTGAKEVELGNNAGGSKDLSCVGMVLAVFLGHRSGDPMLETLGNWVVQDQTPDAWPTNTYFMYYNTLGVFQLGGERWKAWNGKVRDMLINAQRKGQGCFNGSWDWEGTRFAGHDYGRVLSTAYCTLSLEVYYRYAQVQAGKGGKH